MEVSKIVMYIIAATIALCTALVLLAKGVDAMPYGAIGLVGAGVFFVVSLGMTRLH
jgi:hypothetical protein